MGKDHDLLEAARHGNISVVEKILIQKGKRSGPLARYIRPKLQQFMTFTYAMLGIITVYAVDLVRTFKIAVDIRVYIMLRSMGIRKTHKNHLILRKTVSNICFFLPHSDVVRILLFHDASPNLPDGRGSSPLHLAAWAGHQDIVKLLLTHPHRPANPNLQTIDSETPLHCAAQHGHTGALTTLLAHGADPNVQNNRGETPLELAAQYGRLQVVQMLIRAHPELLLPFKQRDAGSPTTVQHSPLHLASRNGHKNVVEVLLAAGVNVNLLTASGTALHEAALCGKDNVVRALLDTGADLDATDSEGRTALDLLEQFPPHVTKGIVSVINSKFFFCWVFFFLDRRALKTM